MPEARESSSPAPTSPAPSPTVPAVLAPAARSGPASSPARVGVLEHSLAAAPPKAAETTPAKQVLEPVTRRGRLVLAPTAEDLELETANGRFELLGPYGTDAHEGDEVEVTGLPDPTARHPQTLPAILIQQMRRI